MITFKSGNIFNEKTDVIVNPVNCTGAMGKGLALEFKIRFPENFKAYQAACQQKKVIPGKIFLHKTCFKIPKFIANFPTKRHWKDRSKLEDIESGLNDLRNIITSLKIKSITIPALGCGLGGLEWGKVRGLINDKLKNLDGVNIIIIIPYDQNGRL